MSLLLTSLLYVAVGCGEWWIALRRTLACARGETTMLVTLVFIENILGLWVLSNFIRSNDWLIAIVYSAGGALGAYLVARKSKKESSKDTSATSQEEKKGAASSCPEFERYAYRTSISSNPKADS